MMSKYGIDNKKITISKKIFSCNKIQLIYVKMKMKKKTTIPSKRMARYNNKQLLPNISVQREIHLIVKMIIFNLILTYKHKFFRKIYRLQHSILKM
jgi:hypothetical protein